jgi:hypothetical protein
MRRAGRRDMVFGRSTLQATIPIRQSLEQPVPWVTASLIAVACLQSQTFFLPVFVWSFLILVPLGIVTWAEPLIRSGAGPAWRDLGVWLIVGLLAVTCAGSLRWESTVFLLSSMFGGLLALRVCLHNRAVAPAAAILFVGLNVVLALLAVAELALDLSLGLLILDNENLRLRGLAMEPNHLGFSLCAAVLVLLYDWPAAWSRQDTLRTIAVAASVPIMLWAQSPFAILMVVMIAAPRLLESGGGRLLLVGALIAGVVIANLSDRVAQILSGEDSSANLRTWGSMLIGYLQIENCGPRGCGLGSGREVLADEPLMAAFAAQETLVLPNLLASSMVDGGWVLLGLIVVVITKASFPAHPYGRFRSVSWALLFLTVAYSASGSYPYDPHFWAALGMLAATTRRPIDTASGSNRELK